ncbi:hypothetical protein CF328_g6133 [Tilletia controversa]|nr:hypothetical protein CF328_g6133 [Tilletia controversa]
MTESATAGTGAQEQEQVYLAFHLLLPRDYPQAEGQRDRRPEQLQPGRPSLAPSVPRCNRASAARARQPRRPQENCPGLCKILGEQKALHASIVALATPPVNKSTSLDQQPNTNTTAAGSAAALNINENFRRTLDIETKARTLGPNLGGFSEQFHAQMQVASTKQRQQQ